MNKKDEVLQWRRLPARLDADQAAALIGVPSSAIALLIAAGLLKPLGKPAQNSTKVFATFELEEHCRDRKWLDKATRCIETYHRGKNEKNKAAAECNGPLNENSCITA